MKLTSSIALITYNGENYLQRQLETLAQQTRLPDELVICDDCSSDRTVEIIKDFASTAPFKVRLYQNNHNLSFGLNFRKAFFLAENDITFFCDQDDVWLPEKIEKVMDCFEKNAAVGMVLSRDIFVDADEKPIKLRNLARNDDPDNGNSEKVNSEEQFIETDFPKLLSKGYFQWAAHNTACRTHFRDALFNNPPPTSVIFDPWVFRCMGALADVCVLKKPYVLWRKHGDSFTSHSKHIRNPFKLMYNSIKRHYNIVRLVEQALAFQQAAEYLSKQQLVHPQIAEFYRGCEHIYKQRIKAVQHPLIRPWIITKELLSGNFKYSPKGFTEVFMDLFAIPQKPDWGNYPTEDLMTKFKTYDQISN